MNNKILFVDDEEMLLDFYRRSLGPEFAIDFALGPEKGVALLNSAGPYAVVVADMRMPGMNGVEFLMLVKTVSPQSVRIMLTGCMEIETTIEAVNQGNVFRFLTKPCSATRLAEALHDGLNEHRLRVGELEAAALDGLTRLYNRNRLDEKITEENDLRKRYGKARQLDYSVVFIDLDNFKHYNDTYGHPVGDLLLREFAGLLKRMVRKTDFAARYGGDEFLLLLPGTNTEGACILASRIKSELIKEKQFQAKIEALIGGPLAQDDTGLSCSMGIAYMPNDDETDLWETLKRADDCLRETKRSGKNGFIVWKKGPIAGLPESAAG
jgi:diguanylate cyclase (GGDEF)-like protein